MKKRVITISLSVAAIILILSLSWGAIAIVQKQKEENVSSLYYTDESIPLEKIHTTADGEKVGLRYTRSLERANGTSLHFYLDGNGNEYSFDASGELISFVSTEKKDGSTQLGSATNNDIVADSPADVTESKSTVDDKLAAYLSSDAPATEEEKVLIATARQYAIETYGEEYFSKFSYSQMIEQTGLKQHRIVFSIRYNQRFTTEGCIVTLVDGVPQRIATFSKGEDEGFDPSLLDGIEIPTLEKYVEAKVKEDYADGYDSFDLEQDITVSKTEDGGHELIIAVMVKTDPEFSGERVKYYYPLG